MNGPPRGSPGGPAPAAGGLISSPRRPGGRSAGFCAPASAAFSSAAPAGDGVARGAARGRWLLVGVGASPAALLDLAVRERRGRGLARPSRSSASSSAPSAASTSASSMASLTSSRSRRRCASAAVASCVVSRPIRSAPTTAIASWAAGVCSAAAINVPNFARVGSSSHKSPTTAPSWPRTAWRVASRPTVHTTRSRNASRVEGRRTTSAASVAAASPTAGSCRSSCAR